MITKQDFIDHGFKASKPFKTDFDIRLKESEYPKEYGEEYKICGWTIHGDKTETPSIVYKHVHGERIVFKKGDLTIFTEWADGDERLRHAYMTNDNSDYYWNEYCPLNMTFQDLIESYLKYFERKRKDKINEYRKSLRRLKGYHKSALSELNKQIKEVEECLK